MKQIVRRPWRHPPSPLPWPSLDGWRSPGQEHVFPMGSLAAPFTDCRIRCSHRTYTASHHIACLSHSCRTLTWNRPNSSLCGQTSWMGLYACLRHYSSGSGFYSAWQVWGGLSFHWSVGGVRRVLCTSESPLPSFEMQLGLSWP